MGSLAEAAEFSWDTSRSIKLYKAMQGACGVLKVSLFLAVVGGQESTHHYSCKHSFQYPILSTR
jgi:hypothetical protein